MLNQAANEALFAEEKECGQLLARCYLKLGQWQESLHGLNEATIPVVLQCYEESTVYDVRILKVTRLLAPLGHFFEK